MPAIFEGDTPFEIYVPSFEEYLAEKYAEESIKLGCEKGKTILRALELRGYYENK